MTKDIREGIESLLYDIRAERYRSDKRRKIVMTIIQNANKLVRSLRQLEEFEKERTL